MWYRSICIYVCCWYLRLKEKFKFELNILWGINIAIVKYLNRRQMLLYLVNYCLYVCLFSAIYICNICNLGWYNMSSLYWLAEYYWPFFFTSTVSKYIMYKAAYVRKHGNVTYIVCSEKSWNIVVLIYVHMGCIYLNVYSKGTHIYYRFMFLYRGCIFYAYIKMTIQYTRKQMCI